MDCPATREYQLGWSMLAVLRPAAKPEEKAALERLDAFRGTRADMETAAAIFLRLRMPTHAAIVMGGL